MGHSCLAIAVKKGCLHYPIMFTIDGLMEGISGMLSRTANRLATLNGPMRKFPEYMQPGSTGLQQVSGKQKR